MTDTPRRWSPGLERQLPRGRSRLKVVQMAMKAGGESVGESGSPYFAPNGRDTGSIPSHRISVGASDDRALAPGLFEGKLAFGTTTRRAPRDVIGPAQMKLGSSSAFIGLFLRRYGRTSSAQAVGSRTKSPRPDVPVAAHSENWVIHWARLVGGKDQSDRCTFTGILIGSRLSQLNTDRVVVDAATRGDRHIEGRRGVVHRKPTRKTPGNNGVGVTWGGLDVRAVRGHRN